DPVGRLPRRLVEHALAPGPEVASGRTAPQRTLERVAVRVHEPGQPEGRGHERRRYTTRGKPCFPPRSPFFLVACWQLVLGLSAVMPAFGRNWSSVQHG